MSSIEYRVQIYMKKYRIFHLRIICKMTCWIMSNSICMKGATCDLPFQVIKHIWKEEVEERPQFRQVILQGGSCQEQFVISWEHL